jgi:site-specific DNA recombinase
MNPVHRESDALKFKNNEGVRKMKKAVIYARVSSKEQEKEGYSIPAQLDLLREYALKNGFEVAREFIDIETAKKAGRENFGKMIQFFKDFPDSRIVLVEKTDRLSRNFRDNVTLEELGVKIHLVKDGRVISKDSSPSEQMIHGINLVLAQHYILNLAEEVKKGMNKKVELGGYPHKAPFGYKNNKEDRTIEINPKEAEVVRQLYEWYAEGGFSLKELRKKAKEDGLLEGISNYKAGVSSIENMLKSPFYYGHFIWKKSLRKGSHEPIVSKELWDVVQSVFNKRTNHNRKPRKNGLLFAGLINCEHCGCLISGEVKKKKYVYYSCTQAKGKCENHQYIREGEIESQMIAYLDLIQFDGEKLEWLKEALKLSHKDEAKYHKKMIRDLGAQLESVKSKIDFMYEDKIEGKISQKLWDRKYEEWSKEQDDITLSIEKHKNADQSYITLGVKLLDLAKNAVSLFQKQDVLGKRELLKIVLQNSFLDGKKVVSTYKTPFDMLVEDAKSKNWLGWLDSNQRSRDQNPLPCRLATPQRLSNSIK